MKRISFLLAVALLLASLAPLAVHAQDKATTVTMAFIEGGPKTLDPQAATTLDEFQVLYNVYEGLMTYDPATLAPVPLLAEKYSISPDNLVYTFNLHKGVKFQNGREMTADDVKYSLERLGNPATGTSYTALLLNNVVGYAEMRAKDNPAKTLSGVKVVDPYTVEITLKAPVASFLNQLTLVGGFVVAKEAAEAPGFGDKPVGTGPYMVDKFERSQQLTLKAFDGYWGGAPKVKEAVLRVIPEASQQVIEYEGGNVDIAVAPESDLGRLSADPKLSKELLTIPILSIFHLRVNLKDPVMSKPEVREALAIAIDREALVKTILGGKGRPAHGVIPPGLTAYDPDYNPFPRDIAKAKELLAKAGYPNGVEILARTGSVETEVRILQAIAQQVAEAGITLKVVSTEKSIWDQDRAKCLMQVGTIAWSQDYADPDNFTLLLTGPSGARAACGYNDYPEAKAINDLLAKGSSMPIGPDRDKVYREAEKTAMDVAALIPLYHGTRTMLVNPRLTGIPVDVNSLALFKNIAIK